MLWLLQTQFQKRLLWAAQAHNIVEDYSEQWVLRGLVNLWQSRSHDLCRPFQGKYAGRLAFCGHIDIICFVFTKVLVKLSQAYTSPTGLQKGIKGWHLSRIEKNSQLKMKAKKMNLKHQLKSFIVDHQTRPWMSLPVSRASVIYKGIYLLDSTMQSLNN